MHALKSMFYHSSSVCIKKFFNTMQLWKSINLLLKSFSVLEISLVNVVSHSNILYITLTKKKYALKIFKLIYSDNTENIDIWLPFQVANDIP